ncbi:RNA polymerase sigma factor [Phycisphaerae bacterium RAS2]|nr:RNA polymerase sigma factor [Phycisphaerae bacterium RAS2]
MMPMDAQRTTVAIQCYLDELAGVAGPSAAEPVVRDLLGRAAQRLHFLCTTLLHRSYPRLARPPANLDSTELLGAVVERLLKAMREARPGTVRQFFAIASQHMRWELNDVARRLDQRVRAVQLGNDLTAQAESTGSPLGPSALKMLQAIDGLPEDERNVFDLLRVQGLTQTETAELLGVTVRTVQRRLSSSLLLLTEKLADLCPPEIKPGGIAPTETE